MNKKGFTLIELVMIIIILGILAVVAIPRYFDLRDSARQSAEDGVVGGVRGGIHTYFANNRGWPNALDAHPNDGSDCDSTNPCFDFVLSQGGVMGGGDDKWSKDTDVYTGPAGNTYAYTSGTGEFK